MTPRLWPRGARAPRRAARAEPGQLVQVLVDGEPVSVLPGQSVAAVLVERGLLSWRTNPVTGEPRGPYCGMGVCFECELTVDGVPDVRACVTGVGAGMRIDTASGRRG